MDALTVIELEVAMLRQGRDITRALIQQRLERMDADTERGEAAAGRYEALHAEPTLAQKRLPKDRRSSLSQMYREGYDFCLACETVTELAAGGGCVLCGSSRVEHRGPAEGEKR